MHLVKMKEMGAEILYNLIFEDHIKVGYIPKSKFNLLKDYLSEPRRTK